MTEINIRIDDARVRRALNDFLRRGRDMSPAMREVAATLEREAEAAIENQRAPDGTAWAELSATTKQRRQKRGTWPGQVLQVSGTLSHSITSAHGADFALAGSNIIYAATHQFGARRGQFGSTKRGAPIPWGDIPARPFLGLSPDGETAVVSILTKHLAEAVQ